MTLRLTGYNHDIDGRFDDRVTFRFAPTLGRETHEVPVDRVHPQALTALRAHLTGDNSNGPVHFGVIGFTHDTGSWSGGLVSVEVEMVRIAPGSAVPLEGHSLGQVESLRVVAKALGLEVD